MIVIAMITAASSQPAAIHMPPVTIHRILSSNRNSGIRARSLRAFELLDRGLQETCGFAAGYRTMVEGQRQRQEAMGDELAVGHDRTRYDPSGAEDRNLRRDDDECGEPPAEHAEIRQSDG